MQNNENGNLYWFDVQINKQVTMRKSGINNMIMKMRGEKCRPGRGKRVKIPPLPNNEGKKSLNNTGPQQGHDNLEQIPVEQK